MPKSNVEFWREKFRHNVQRDTRNKNKLVEEGWDVCIIWECQTKNSDDVINKLEKFFDIKKSSPNNCG